MKKYLVKISLLIFIFFINSCCREKWMPSVTFENFSSDYVYDVKGKWDGVFIPKSSQIKPGLSSGFGLVATRSVNPFSPLTISWRNLAGQTLTKTFNIEKSNFKNPKAFAKKGFVHFYLYQDHVDFYAFDNEDINDFYKVRDVKQAEFAKDRYESLTPSQQKEVDKVFGGKYHHDYKMQTRKTNDAESLIGKFRQQDREVRMKLIQASQNQPPN